MASNTSPKAFSSVSYLNDLPKLSSSVSYSNDPTSSPTQSTCSPASSRTPWDVFLSFRGEDTRYNFISHLYSALDCHGIRIYMDNAELRTGKAVSDALIAAIRESKIYIVVFSENYAASSWCLDELVEIYKCHQTTKRLIISVYYKIDPSTVRHQTGSFEEAFKNHETRLETGFLKNVWREHRLGSEVQKEKVAKWRLTLTKVAGFTENPLLRPEIDIIDQVLERILLEIQPKNTCVAKYPVGLESRVENIMALMSSHAEEEGVTTIGIYGMSGIGKTTLAKAVYNQNYHRFQGSCFLQNVGDTSKTERGLVRLQQQLINDVLKSKNIIIDNINQGIELITANIRSIKVLIVIDGLDNPRPMKFLKGTLALGSIIFVTTRNEGLLDSIKVEDRYKVKELNDRESLQLFTQHAFQNNHMSDTFTELSKEIVECAGGLPLALVIFGSTLFKESEEEWRRFRYKLKQDPIEVVDKTLMDTFDALKSVHPMLQDIFLDIACFFIGWSKQEVVKILDTCYVFSDHNIDILKKRCLLTISKEDKLEMHSILREMGRKIARNDSQDEPEKHSRLWVSEDILKVLNNRKGTEAVKGIIPSNLNDQEALEVISVNMETFKSMSKLRFLHLKNINPTGSFEHIFDLKNCCPDEPQKQSRLWTSQNIRKVLNKRKGIEAIKGILPSNLNEQEELEVISINTESFRRMSKLRFLYLKNVYPSGSFEHTFEELRWLCWDRCPLQYLPFDFYPRNLVTLVLPHSNLRVLWESNMVFENLKTLDMKHSLDLTTTPNFTTLPCLEFLNFEYCKSLEEIHVSIGTLERLAFLNLCGCAKLRNLPNSICKLRALTSLNIGGCSSFTELPSELGNIESLTELNAWGLTVQKLPDSMRRLSKLYDLNLSDNEYLETPSSSASDLTPTGWDVYINMRGMDTRLTFTNHLYSILNHHGVRVFLDEPELQSGQDISSSLFQAIMESKTYIVILSENYASSPWCLDELVEILNCCKTTGRLVIPVFYNIDQLLVHHQTGSFKQDFEKHETHFAGEKVKKWRHALTEVAEFSGYHISNHRSEDDVMNEIVDRIIFEINPKALTVAKHPVRLGSRVKEVTTMLSTCTEGVIKFGIYGMGGVGKTTLAKALFNQLLLGGSFKGSCFLADVGEVSRTFKGLVSLQEKIIKDVLQKKRFKLHNLNQGIELIKDRICSAKVLVALDNLADPEQFRSLVGPFASGSVVIITTRNSLILDEIGVDPKYQYMVNVLDPAESLALFTRHAFGNAKPNNRLMILSKEILPHAGGHPLVLEVFGSHLSLISEVGWKSHIAELQLNPESNIQKKLVISLDALESDDPMLKKMFLDIACFFVGEKKEKVVKIMETYYNHVDHNIDILRKRCLLTINNRDELKMHDLLQNMGREIARNNFRDEPGRHSRLWLPKDISYMLKKHKGTEDVEGIISCNHDALEGESFSTETFKSMNKLRFLYLKKVNLSGSFERIFEDLRWLCWDCCPMECLPSEFYPEKLVVLELPHSNLRTMWDPNMISHAFESLKTLNMSFSLDLATTPDFTKLPCLEFLNLKCCKSLVEMHISIGSLERLVSLDLNGCVKLDTLPDTICRLGALEVLNIGNCSSLKALPTQLGNIQSLKQLNGDGLSVLELPDSIGHLSKLVQLRLSYNKNLETLPETIYKLKSLENLDIGYCSHLLYIAELPFNLKWISADGCTSLRRLPNLSNLKHLEELRLADCSSLTEILGLEKSSIRVLHLRGCNSSLLAYITERLFQEAETLQEILKEGDW